MINKKAGFTLIELLVSISIIAILTVIASISFAKAQKNGRDQRRIEDLKSIQNAAEQYYLLSGSYPISGKYTAGATWTTPTSQVVLQRYPADPKNDVSSGYVYTIPVTPTNNAYCICAKMENGKGGNSESDCSFVDQCLASPNNCYFCVKNQQ